ncbi:hypothetical protein AMJ82_09370 [candidate division TA06 bacterium SM23_40]|uniref:Uncharacterized protein n=1 Tax=candidate division TA06 bacterium SM23_40 TaxID=1703774 RepID=A0A0S8G4U6_UNCT6|nr:MAG: hypothetical protein AMJ82_09370 [candidate division TA06 bacterium SM23_40]
MQNQSARSTSQNVPTMATSLPRLPTRLTAHSKKTSGKRYPPLPSKRAIQWAMYAPTTPATLETEPGASPS